MQKSGVVLLNKAPLINSTALVSVVKRVVDASKTGHLGTLDSLGAGVLPIAVGKATRIFDYFLNKRKTYRAIFQFGVQTDTFDADGTIVATNNKIVSKQEVISVLPELVGVINQTPPQFSAKKIAGKRASDYMREGETVELKSCQIEIFSFKLIEELQQNLMLFEIECSAGTYIRSLCRDLAQLCDSCATMVCIIRTKCGIFNIEETSTLEQVRAGEYTIIPTWQVLHQPIINITEQAYKSILDGKQTTITGLENGEYQLMYQSNLFVLANVINEMISVLIFFGE